MTHKPLCKSLKACREAPILDEYLSSMRASPTQIGIATTQAHGTIAFVMERKEWYHVSENDREVILASSSDLSEHGLQVMICNSVLYPEYDNDLAGSRRPDAVCLHSKSFRNDPLARRLANLVTRLGIRVVDMGGEFENVWCKHWLCVQKGWLDELYDGRFLDAISVERRIPYEPNGQARRYAGFVSKKLPRLNPEDYPTSEQVMSLPFEEEKNSRGLWIACHAQRLFICYHGPDGFSLRYHIELALQTNRRPYPTDVMLCINHVIFHDIQKRPVGAWLGQPSICSHNDVEIYEAVLDGKIIEGNLTLGAMNSMETQLEGMMPRFHDAGLLDDGDKEEQPMPPDLSPMNENGGDQHLLLH